MSNNGHNDWHRDPIHFPSFEKIVYIGPISTLHTLGGCPGAHVGTQGAPLAPAGTNERGANGTSPSLGSDVQWCIGHLDE